MTASERMYRITQEYRRVFPNNADAIHLLNEATELVDLKEQNRIIELPVPLGSKCYQIVCPHPFKDKSFVTEQDMTLWLLASNSVTEGGIFATREEAEKRLEEMRSE